ncbi:nitroreductase family protein [Chloroflexota bacterium]
MEILKLIQERQSTRAQFDPDRSIGKQDVEQILEAARWAPTAHNMQNFEIIAVDDKELLEAIANIRSRMSKTFIRENYQQLSFSEEELLNKKFGVLSTTFPPAMINPEAIKDKSTGGKTTSFLGRTIRTGSVLLIVVYDPSRRAPASKGDFLGIMSLGCVMENMWLMAHSLGIGFQILSVLSGYKVEKQVKSILNIPEHLKIAFSARLGYPISLTKRLRVRREVNDFTHHNRFGSSKGSR